jgi:hypothetical protein
VSVALSRLAVFGVLAHFLFPFGVPMARAEQCPTPQSPIETDRPDVTNSSVVVP